MSTLLPLVIFVLVVGFIAIILDRRWQTRKANKASLGQGKGDSTATSEKSSGFGSLKNRVMGGKNQKELTKKFQAWAEKTLTAKEKDLNSWIAALSPEEAKTFTGN